MAEIQGRSVCVSVPGPFVMQQAMIKPWRLSMSTWPLQSILRHWAEGRSDKKRAQMGPIDAVGAETTYPVKRLSKSLGLHVPKRCVQDEPMH